MVNRPINLLFKYILLLMGGKKKKADIVVPDGDPAKGKAEFTSLCGGCHSMTVLFYVNLG